LKEDVPNSYIRGRRINISLSKEQAWQMVIETAKIAFVPS